MNSLNTPICYLCNQQIQDPADISWDHVVPHQFIKRDQPKAKGFSYAGKLPTHTKCNNDFGSEDAKAEVICQKALEMLRVLHDENCFSVHQYKDNPDIRILAINGDCLNNLTEQEKAFFGLIDVRNTPYQAWRSASFFADKKKVNVLDQARNVALSVLTKSAAAILIKRQHVLSSSIWRIVAVPHFIGDAHIELNEIFGETKPFEVGVQAWIDQHANGDWLVIYKVNGLLVELHFALTTNDNTFQTLRQLFPNTKQYVFESNELMDLVGYNWCANPY